MHIVIPMSGTGQRFLDAGYTTPKPLIEVDGKPIIEHVVDMFPGEEKFTFICNAEHLAETDMAAVLRSIKPLANILSIPPHKKGPVFAVAQIFDSIEDEEEEVIINYCDFGKKWDYPGFLRQIRERKSDGAVSAYRGFHPHMLGTVNYAFMREKDLWMLEIQEKKPFTDNRMNEFASDGTYYFRSGAIMKEYFRRTMERDISVNGEYYVSVVYNLLVEDGLKVSIFEIEQMLQWGTPGELEEYLTWSNLFRALAIKQSSSPHTAPRINLIPMAGRGQRFADRGYSLPKPLIPVDGEAMVIHAAKSLPPASINVFVCLKEHLEQYPLEKTLRRSFPDARIISLDSVTEGQAITVSMGIRPEDEDLPLLIAASDNGMLFDIDLFERYASDPGVDAVVFTFSGYPTMERNPTMYGWVKHSKDTVVEVSVKKPISNHPQDDDAIVGAFYFRTTKLYAELLEKLTARDLRINGEFYVDSIIALAAESGLNVRLLRVDHYICWGTPDDYLTYDYWQRFFSQCRWHPYGGAA